MDSILSRCIKQSIRSNPQAAAREIPEILNFYATDIERLNRVLQAAERVLIQPDNFALEILRQAVREAKCQII